MTIFRIGSIVGREVRSLFSTVAHEELLFQKHVKPKIDYFRSQGWSLSDCQRVFKQFPPALFNSLEEQILPIVQFLKEMDHGGPHLKENDIRETFQRHPSIFGLSIERELCPVFELWRREMKFTQKQMRTLTVRAPQLLSVPLEDMKSRMIFFHNRSATTNEIVHLFSHFPEIMNIPVEALMQFHAYWKEVLMSNRDFVSMSVRYPPLLKLSFHEVLRPMLDYMIYICRNRKGALLFVYKPEMFEMRIDVLSQKVEFLLNLGLSRKTLILLIIYYPEFFEMKMQTFKSRIEKLLSNGNLSIERLGQILLKNPELLIEEELGFPSPSCRWTSFVQTTSCPSI